MERIAKQQVKKSKKTILLVGLGILASGTLGYFGYQYWKGRREKETESLPDILTPPPGKDTFIPPALPKRNDDFPLKKGSKGSRVKQIQEALIEKNGKQLFPKYGADGSFGAEMIAALTKLGYPVTIDESTFNIIVKSDFNANAIATDLYNAAIKKDFAKTVALLSKIKSKEDYSAVSEKFKIYRIGGVRQTLVNGILNSFPDEKQKQVIRLQFSRMGLNYDGSKWSLSGIPAPAIITRCSSLVWLSPTAACTVPASVILGRAIAQKEQNTLFINNGRYFLVPTNNICHL
jgi:hypothetical protein